MNSNRQVEREQQAGTTMATQVATFFARLSTAGIHPRLLAVTGISQFNIEGAGSWRVRIKDGVVSVAETDGKNAPADAVVTTTAENMVRILRGEGFLNAFSAVLQEIMTVRGDPAFTTSLLDVFSFGQGGTDT